MGRTISRSSYMEGYCWDGPNCIRVVASQKKKKNKNKKRRIKRRKEEKEEEKEEKKKKEKKKRRRRNTIGRAGGYGQESTVCRSTVTNMDTMQIFELYLTN